MMRTLCIKTSYGGSGLRTITSAISVISYGYIRWNGPVPCSRHLLLWFNTVKLLDAAMDSETNRGVEPLEMHLSNGALDTVNPHPTGMYKVCHGSLLEK